MSTRNEKVFRIMAGQKVWKQFFAIYAFLVIGFQNYNINAKDNLIIYVELTTTIHNLKHLVTTKTMTCWINLSSQKQLIRKRIRNKITQQLGTSKKAHSFGVGNESRWCYTLLLMSTLQNVQNPLHVFLSSRGLNSWTTPKNRGYILVEVKRLK